MLCFIPSAFLCPGVGGHGHLFRGGVESGYVAWMVIRKSGRLCSCCGGTGGEGWGGGGGGSTSAGLEKVGVLVFLLVFVLALVLVFVVVVVVVVVDVVGGQQRELISESAPAENTDRMALKDYSDHGNEEVRSRG